LVNNELEKDLDGSGHGVLKVLPQHFPGYTEQNHENPETE
jgi:hypothetical protein